MTLLFKGLDVPTKIEFLLVHGSNFGQMPFLPSLMTHMGTSGSWIKARWVQVHRITT